METLGAGTAWLRCGEDGRLYAVNPEQGLSAAATGTGNRTDPMAMRTIEQGNTISSRVGLTDDGDVWWEGMTDTPPTHLTDWTGRDWTPAADRPAAHPNSRYQTPIRHCPALAPEWDDPNGVPLSAILFSARRTATIPLVTESRDWRHGVFFGATLSTDTDSDREVGRDPMGMREFLGYHAGDYLAHWLFVGGDPRATALPKIYQVNWSRRDDRSGDRSDDIARVLAWIVGRLEGTAAANDGPIGWVPDASALDLTGLDGDPTDVAAGIPVGLRDELRALRQRLRAPS